MPKLPFREETIFDKLCAEFDSLKKELGVKLGKEDLDFVFQKLDEFRQDFSHEISKREDRIQKLEKQIDVQSIEMQEVKAIAKGVRASLVMNEESSVELVQRLEGRISALHSACVTHYHFDEHAALCDNRMRKVEDLLISQGKIINQIEEMLLKHEGSLKSHELCDERDARSIEAIDVKLIGMEKVLLRKAKENDQVINQNFHKSQVSFEEAMRSLKAELESSPASLLALKEELLAKMKSLELDAANSVLRSTNVDSQVKVLERKIDHILNQIKKIELNQG